MEPVGNIVATYARLAQRLQSLENDIGKVRLIIRHTSDRLAGPGIRIYQTEYLQRLLIRRRRLIAAQHRLADKLPAGVALKNINY